MELRQLHEIMLGLQRLKIYIEDQFEPVFIGYNGDIDETILDEQIEFIFSSTDEDIIIIQLERRY